MLPGQRPRLAHGEPPHYYSAPRLSPFTNLHGRRWRAVALLWRPRWYGADVAAHGGWHASTGGCSCTWRRLGLLALCARMHRRERNSGGGHILSCPARMAGRGHRGGRDESRGDAPLQPRAHGLGAGHCGRRRAQLLLDRLQPVACLAAARWPLSSAGSLRGGSAPRRRVV